MDFDVTFNFGSVLLYIVSAAAYWRLFQKMGRQGWEGIIPLYREYCLFEELYGNGWKILGLLIPFYNIYVAIKLEVDFCHAFHKYGGFVAGFIFLNPVFLLILAFTDAQYLDGSRAIGADDPISRTLDEIAGKAGSYTAPTANDAARRLHELDDLRKSGIITEE